MNKFLKITIILVAFLSLFLLIFQIQIKGQIQKIAADTENPLLCPFAFDSDLCYSLIGMKTQNPTLCEKVSEKSMWRDTCFNDLGSRMNKIHLCKKINADNLKLECYKIIASNNKDISVCNDLIKPNLINICKEFVNNKLDLS